MGSFCTALFGSSQSTTYTPPESVKTAINDILTRAATQSNQPYPTYSPDTAAQYLNYVPGLVAPMTPDQVAAGNKIADLSGYTDPNFAAATALASQAATPLQMQRFSRSAVNQYMNPYMSDVVNAAVQNINQTNAQQQQQVLGSAIGQGAYGGDRAGIAQAELARQQNLANNATIANLLNQGYTNAQNMFTNQQGVDLTTQLQNRDLLAKAGINLANLGTQGQQAALQQAQAQYGYGTSQQQQQQAGLSTAYQQWLNQQMFPYQQLSYYAGLTSGAAPAMGGMTTGYTPTVSPAAGAIGGISFLGNLSNAASSTGNPFGAGMNALGLGSGSIFPMKSGGRVGYAEGGVPVKVDPSDAYNDYIKLISSGRATYAQINAAYQRYLDSFKGAKKPWEEKTTADTATDTTIPVTTKDTTTKSAETKDGGRDRAGSPVTGLVSKPDYERTDIGTKAYPQGGREIIEGPELSVEPNQTLNALLRGNAPLITGDYPQPNALSGLGDVAKLALGMAIPGLGLTGLLARDPKQMTDQYGSLYGQANRTALPQYDSEGNRIRTPNTASGQTLSEYMESMNITDPSKVRMGMSYVNGYPQPEFFVDSPAARALHPNSVPALDVAGVKEPTEASQQNGTGFALPGEETSTGLRTPGQFSLADLASIGKAYGLPAGYLEAQAQIESDLNPNAKSPYSTAAGLYQIIKSNYEKAGIDPYNPEQAASWTAQNAAENARRLEKEGYEVNNANLALAHNFGIEGALALLSQPQRSIFDSLKTVMSEDNALKAVTGNKYNISDPSATALGRLQSRINAATEALGPLSTQQPGWMQPRGTNITNEHPQGIVPPQISDQNIARNFEKNATSGLVVEPSGVIPGTKLYDPTQGGAERLDRTATAEDTSTVEPGSSLGPRGLSFSPSNRDSRDTPDVKSEPNEATGETRTYGGGSDTMGIFNHGGRIRKAEAGGISMQYGMPTEEDIQRMVTNFAGSGVGNLNPQLRAMASKGVLLSKRDGGRIHKDDGGSASAQNPKSITLPEAISGLGQDIIDYFNSSRASPQGHGRFGERKSTPLVAVDTNAQPGRGIVVEKPGERAAAMAPKPIDPGSFFKGKDPTETLKAHGEEPSVKMELASTKTQPVLPRRYMSPPPADLKDFFGMNYGLGLLSGQNLAAAGNMYAQNIMAQQNQQREQMEAEQRTRASQATEQQTRTIQTLQGLGERYEDEQGNIRIREVPISEEGAPAGGAEAGKIAGGTEGTSASTQDMELGPVVTGDDVPPGSVAKTEILKERGKPFKKQAYGLLAPDLGKTYSDLQKEAQKDAEAAQNTYTDINQAVKAITNIDDKGFLAQGAAIGFRTNVANYLNTMWKVSGLADKYGPLAATEQNLSSQQILEKIATLSSQESQRGLGREAGFWLNALKLASPNAAMTKAAANELLANMIVSNTRRKERSAVYDAYGPASGRMGADAAQVFEKVNPGRLYDKELAVITELLNNTIELPDGTRENAITALKGGRIFRADFDANVKKMYGITNLSRHF